MTKKQKERLSKAPKNINRLMVAAMKALLQAYIKRTPTECLLCQTAFKKSITKGACDICPWGVMTGYSCHEYARIHRFKEDPSILRPASIDGLDNFFSIDILKYLDNAELTKEVKRWRRLRIRQLKCWIREYEEMLNENL